MSRSGAVIILLAVVAAHPARAQDDVDRRVGEMIDRQKQVFGIPVRKARCQKGAAGEIVVCAPDQDRFRAQSTADIDPKSPQALRDGVPRAPDFSGSCAGQPGCIMGGWAPPPIYIIDLDAIPMPAPGSDADRIAKGEMAAP